MPILQEFKEFALKGSVADMAIGVIIGAAFGQVVSSLVKDVLMPPLGLLMGQVDFSQFVLVLKEKSAVSEAVVLRYGLFFNSILDFVIVAGAIFLAMRQVNRWRRQPDEGKSAGDRSCRFCKSVIHPKASRCPHCTSKLQNA